MSNKLVEFDDVVRRWIAAGTKKDDLVRYMADCILEGPLICVPPKLREIAMTVRTLRAGVRRRTRKTRRV